MLKKLAVVAFCVAVVWLLTTPPAYADDWDKATRITVNQPFEIPGKVLPAGTYVVRLVDLAAERHVVRFLSEDEKTVYATLIGIPDFRLEPTDKTAITFYESEFNRPRALHNWFYPGHQFGIEFAYPKARAAEIAWEVEEPVVAFEEPTIFTHEAPAEVPVEELLKEPLVEVTPAGEEVAVAATPEFAPAAEPEPAPAVAEPLPLPKTATPLPLFGLVGLLAAGVAYTLRFFK